jgi:hypothetical protein
MKINLDKDFEKYVGSWKKAHRIVSDLAKKAGESLDCIISRGRHGNIHGAYGVQTPFRWRYIGESKTLEVAYTDGRPKPEKKEPKKTFYIIWVEGLSVRGGEKIKRVTKDGFEYTTEMTKALRVKPEDLKNFKQMMRNRGIANWVIDNPNSFVKTHYAPKNKLFTWESWMS